MKIFSIRHLHWVLWVWLLLSEANGEDGVAKSVKRLEIKQKSGPRGDSLVGSFVQTRVSRAFSSTSTFEGGRGEEEENNKPPDDRQSTIRIRNETVDLSKNTVPVLKYPGPTEPSLKDKYRRTTFPAESSPLKKNFKLKRNMTRPRPGDLTTLLAFNALTPSPSSEQPKLITRTRPQPSLGGYLSTTQMAESMPPTAWALASLKGPADITRKPGSPYVRPFVSWSTRLNKPNTTASPTPETSDPVTGSGETSADLDTIGTDITAEGVDRTESMLHPTADSAITSANADTIPDLKKQNVTTSTANTTAGSTEKPQDITSYKPEENTISVPPLESLKNFTHEDNFDKADVLPIVNINLPSEKIESHTVSAHELNSNYSAKSHPQVVTLAETSDNSSTITFQDAPQPLKLSTETTLFNASYPINESNSSETTEQHANTNSTMFPVDALHSEQYSESTKMNLSDSSLEPETKLDTIKLNTTESNSSTNNSILIDETLQKHIPSAEEKNISTVIATVQPDSVETNPTELTEKASTTLKDEAPHKPNENVSNETVQEVDPSINAINEKKSDEQLPTSTDVSFVNSSISVHVAPVVTTPGNTNLTNLVEEELKKIEDNFELAKNLPLTAETTASPAVHSTSSTLVPVLNKAFPFSHIEQNPEIINQTSNDIKPINSINLSPLSFESNTETTSSTRSNEIKPEVLKSNSNLNETINKTETKHKDVHDLPETTQSNYIQVQESIKPQNKSHLTLFHLDEEDQEKQKDFETPPPMTTVNPVLNTSVTSLNISSPIIKDSENVTIENNSETNITTPNPTTVETESPITTTPLPTTTNSPAFTEVLPSSISENSTTPPAHPSATQAPPSVPTTIKSNDIKDQEGLTDMTTPPALMTTTKSNDIKDQESLPDINLSPSPSSTTMSNNITNQESSHDMNLSPTTPKSNDIKDQEDLTYVTLPPSSPTTSKSNDIKDQEGLTDINLPISEKNMTQFQYESPNTQKNESTLIIQEPDEIEEDDGVYNHTDISDKKNPSDSINNGDGDDDAEDNFHDVIGNSSISANQPNISKDHLSPTTSSTTMAPVELTTSKTTTLGIDDVIPTQIDEDPLNPDDDRVDEPGVIMPVYIKITFDANYGQLCQEKDQLRDAIVRIFKKYAERTLDKRQVVLVNLGIRECSSLRGEMNERHTPVHLMLTDPQGQYDKTLNDQFVSLMRQRHFEFKYPIMDVEKIIEQHELSMDAEPQPSGTVVAAIIISSIAGVCLFALTILLVIMRKRQSGFNYGQRCTPVSLDDYSLDNISVYNSVRRKALRASKRSYGNPAFDDPDAISNPVNFAGLANMASDKSKTDEEFTSLPQVVVKPDELPPGAESKNRYANVIPLPETRVQLKGNSPEEQFINANYVKGAKGAEKFYIACQAPLQNTIEDFWQMIWDEQCRLVIMLTALSENGVEKCADYLPPSEVLDCHRIFGDLQVTLKKREAREKYVIASLQLKNLETNLWREVTHMWYAGWPPTGVPSEPSSVIAFLIEARSYSKGAPVVVHCSPGTGRTGTVIAIDVAIRDFEAGRSVDIPKTVVQVRRGRAGAVQTKDQYHFIYKVLHLYATKLTGGGLDSI